MWLITLVLLRSGLWTLSTTTVTDTAVTVGKLNERQFYMCVMIDSLVIKFTEDMKYLG